MNHSNPFAATTDAATDPPAGSNAPDAVASVSFAGYLSTQFLGAFNDNLFKQLLLLLAIPTAAQIAAGEGTDSQGIATIVFGLPFVLFSGLAGFLADKQGKRTIMFVAKVAEIGIMGLGLAAFYFAPQIGFLGLWLVLFLMGLQSTFFGPAKYGILPEMLRRDALPRANGLVLMTTFIAIIIGTAIAGPIKDYFVDPRLPPTDAARGLAWASLICVGLAVVGTITSLLVNRRRPADPDMTFDLDAVAVPAPIRGLLRHDWPLTKALLASCIFWLVSGLVLQSVNSLAKVQLQVSDSRTSILVSLISVGIAIGGAAAGSVTRRIGTGRVLRLGLFGMVVFCALMSISPGGKHLLGFAGSIPVLIALGASAAFFAIPIQVFLQDRPPENLKGRMIAVMNQTNFLAIVVSGRSTWRWTDRSTPPAGLAAPCLLRWRCCSCRWRCSFGWTRRNHPDGTDAT